MIPTDVGEFRWIYSDPNIILHHHYNLDTQNDYGEFLPHSRFFRGVHYCWHKTPENILAADNILRKNRPTHIIFHMIPDAAYYDHVTALGVTAIHFSHNALINENVFTIGNEPKKYDAILNARAYPGKRHWLAAKVENLCLSTYFNEWCDPKGYLDEVIKQLPKAHYHFNKGPIEPATQNGILQKYQQSRVGLCLSDEEGASLSSVEYMLCGLPVVTTANNGGRNEFMDPEFTLIVPATQQAVADGVSELIKRNISPFLIRGRTLQRMGRHRARFIDHVQKILNYHQVAVDYGRIFYHNVPQMGVWRPLAQIETYKDEWRTV